MLRWHQLGISKHSVIEWQASRFNAKTFETIRESANLRDVSPHTLRHKSISWYLRAGVAISDVSDYCGVSETIIRQHYKHHLPGTYERVFGKIGKNTEMKEAAN